MAYHHLAGGTFIMTYLVMLVGAYTSAIGAGLACPDWPTCYGTWIPFLHQAVIAASPYTRWQIFSEWTHRVLAMIAGIMMVGTTMAAWRFQREHRLVVGSATLALILLPFQVFLGRLTVTRTLQPVVVTAHLGIAILILLSLLTTTLTSWLQRKDVPVRS